MLQSHLKFIWSSSLPGGIVSTCIESTCSELRLGYGNHLQDLFLLLSCSWHNWGASGDVDLRFKARQQGQDGIEN